ARVDFIRHFSDELAQVLDALPRAQQVVIFVDDLDRCPPDQTLEMLEALQLLTESQRCYFVLGMDQTMVRYAVELKYRSLLELREKHGEDTTGFGAHYLEKIITLAVHVPLVRATEIEEEVRTSAEQLAAYDRDEHKRGSTRGLLSASQAFLVAWLLTCFLGFGYLFLTSTPARITETSTSAAKDAKEQPAAQQAEVSAPVVQLPAAGEAPSQVAQSAADLAKNAREIPRERPPAAATSAAATSTRPADHVYRQSRNMLLGLLFASAVACVVLLAVAAVLYSRLRSIGPAGSPVKDSPEFNAALRVYLAHLPQNPRKLIRSGNAARFMYYLLGNARPGCSPATFFASLLAEQYLRPVVGEARDAGELARQVMIRECMTDDETIQEQSRIINAWSTAKVPQFDGVDHVDAAFCEELRSWLRGATTA
ncbi:MAG TPA: P-loop NTPase fold protein, partial [Polyangiales bacterium]|nr:P-loop NTPase fold protein [Polyangiales bacterium]